MHELHEVHAMIRQACAQTPSTSRVKRMRILIGEASGHDRHHIEEHFVEASRGTKAEGAMLEFVSERLEAKCATCGTAFTPGERAFACAHCGGKELVITAGKDVRLTSVETES